MKKLLIKNGHIVNPATNFEGMGDILVSEGTIICVSPEINDDEALIIDAKGLTVAPGLIDVHSHFRDPGFTAKEDIFTGAEAAAAGGYTTVVLMCNTNPVADTAETVEYVLNKGKQTAINVETCGAVTKGLKGEKLTDFDELLKAGAVGFTDDGIPLMDGDILKTALVLSGEKKVPISLHEEDKTLISENGINAGKASEYYGIKGSPRDAEISLIARDLKIAAETEGILNIQHISTKEGVELVREAKKTNANVHAEATPQHFSLTEDAVIKKGSFAKLNPPLRTEEDRKAVIEGLRDGTIDIIATDHAPHTTEEKSKKITEAPSGMIGLETALSLAVTTLVREEKMSLMEVLKKLTVNPARLYSFTDRGSIEPGYRADILIFDPESEVVYSEFKSKAENSPFTGEKMFGKVVKVICSGNIVYEN